MKIQRIYKGYELIKQYTTGKTLIKKQGNYINCVDSVSSAKYVIDNDLI